MIVVIDTNVIIKCKELTDNWRKRDIEEAFDKLNKLREECSVKFVLHSEVVEEFKPENMDKTWKEWVKNNGYSDSNFNRFCYEETFPFLVEESEKEANKRIVNSKEKNFHPQLKKNETVLKDADIFVASTPFFDGFKNRKTLILSNEIITDPKARDAPFKIPRLIDYLKTRYPREVFYEGCNDIYTMLAKIDKFANTQPS